MGILVEFLGIRIGVVENYWEVDLFVGIGKSVKWDGAGLAVYVCLYI